MLNWGILGTANIAQRSVIPAILSIPGNTIIGIGSREQIKADSFAKEFNALGIKGYQALLDRDDINAVYIPLPTGMHFEWVMKALEKGKHVLVEKSAVENYQQAIDMVNKSREKGLALVEHFQFQYHSQHKFVFEQLNKGLIGDIRCFRSSFGFPPFCIDNNIRYEKKLGGGALLDSGAYTLKAVSFLMGEGFKVDTAFLNYHKKFGIDWFGGGQLSNKDKNIFAQVAFGFDNFYQCNYEIWGSLGKIISTRAFTAKPNYKPSIILQTSESVKEVKLEPDNHFINIIEHFTSIIENKQFEEDRKLILEQARLISEFKDCAK